MIKQIAYSIVIYFTFIFIFKLLGDMSKNGWVNYYWLCSSLFYAYLFSKIRGFCNYDVVKNTYHRKDIILYKLVITLAVAYWGIMSVVRIIVAVDIDLYDVLISNTRAWTVGGVYIIILFVIIIFKTAKKNDRKNER